MDDFNKQWHYRMELIDCVDDHPLDNSPYPAGLICAEEFTKTSCFVTGDSGSPLMVMEENLDRYYTEGILSFIKSCTFLSYSIFQRLDNPGFYSKVSSVDPSAYTKLSCYLPWIAQQYNLDYTAGADIGSQSSSVFTDTPSSSMLFTSTPVFSLGYFSSSLTSFSSVLFYWSRQYRPPLLILSQDPESFLRTVRFPKIWKVWDKHCPGCRGRWWSSGGKKEASSRLVRISPDVRRQKAWRVSLGLKTFFSFFLTKKVFLLNSNVATKRQIPRVVT